MHMARGGDAQGGEGGCTCILCIPPGYAPACGQVIRKKYEFFCINKERSRIRSWIRIRILQSEVPYGSESGSAPKRNGSPTLSDSLIRLVPTKRGSVPPIRIRANPEVVGIGYVSVPHYQNFWKKVSLEIQSIAVSYNLMIKCREFRVSGRPQLKSLHII